MYERIFNKMQLDIVNEIEKRIPFIMDNYDDLTRSQAEERACEAILDEADEMGLFHMFEFILKEAGYWPYAFHLDNPYGEFRKTKSEAQSSFESMMGISDLSQLLSIRGLK